MTDRDWQIERFKEHAVNHPMDPEVKKLLVEALRSGEYKQTKGYLQVKEKVGQDRNPGFCCLGVLSEIAKNTGTLDIKCQDEPAHDGVVVEYFHGTKGSDDFYYERSRTALIESIEQWAGIDDSVSSSLMGMNDNGISFAEIADLIEEHL